MYIIIVNDNFSDVFWIVGIDVVFFFVEILDFDVDYDVCFGDVFEYGIEVNIVGINNVSWILFGGGNIIVG